MEDGYPSNAAGVHLLAPPHCQNPFPAEFAPEVAVPPSTSMEAVLPPSVSAQGTEAAPVAEVRPMVAEDSGASEPDAPLDSSLTWA